MTVELRSLRVVPELDASKYVAGAQQKVAADKAMTASAQATGAAQAAADTKISQAGDVLARLSRQYVDGYANAQKMQSAVNALSRGIETGKIQMAQAQPILDGIYRKYGQLGDGAQFAAKGQHEFAAAITSTTARLSAQVGAANAAAASVGRVNVAANQNAVRSAQNFSTSNVAAQFQDIGVTAAMGMSPLQIALQQGTQLSAVLGNQGAAGAARTLGAALLSVVSPVSLITIGIVGLSAAAIQYFGRLMSDSADSEKALKAQAELISGVAREWGNALPSLQKYNDELARQKSLSDAIEASRVLGNREFDPFRSGGGVLSFGESQIGAMRSNLADLRQMLQSAGTDTQSISGLQNAFDTLAAKIANSTAKAEDATRVQTAINDIARSTGIPTIADYATEYGTLAEQIQKASENQAKFIQDAAMLQMKQGLGPLNPLDGFNRTPFQTSEDIMFERSRRARQAEEARIGGLEIGGFVPTPRPNDIERLGEGPSGADYIRSQQERIELLKTEAGVLGETAGVRNRVITSLQVEQEIRRRGLDLHGEEADAMRANALLEIDLIEQISERRTREAKERQDQIAALDQARGEFRSFLGDLKAGLQSGDSFWESFANAASNAFDKILDRWLDLLTEMILGKSGTNQTGLLGGLLGGNGASPFSANMTAGQFFGAGAPAAANSNSPVAASAQAYRDAIASIESAGSGGYAAIGPTHPKMGRALGRYQIMEANVGPWSEAALGNRIGADEFMKNPGLQDKIFDHRFGGYVDKYGFKGASQAWFAGEAGMKNKGATDVLGTSVGSYGDKAAAALAKLGDKANSAVTGLDGFTSNLTQVGSSLASPNGPLGGLFGTGLDNFANFKDGAGGGLGGLLGYGGGGGAAPSGGGGGILGMLLGFLPKLFGFAEGTDNAPPGYAWVGERGPEIVKFRGGEQVVPNHKIGANQNTFAPVFNINAQGSTMSASQFRSIARQEAEAASAVHYEMLAQGGFGGLQSRYQNQKQG